MNELEQSIKEASEGSSGGAGTQKSIITAIVIILIAVAVLAGAFYSMFLTKPGTEHSGLAVIGFVWVLLPGVCVVGKLAHSRIQN